MCHDKDIAEIFKVVCNFETLPEQATFYNSDGTGNWFKWDYFKK